MEGRPGVLKHPSRVLEPESESGNLIRTFSEPKQDTRSIESGIRNWTGSVSMRSTAAQGDEDHVAGEHVDEVSESEDCEAGKKPQAGRRFRIVPEPELEDGSGQSRKS